MKHDIRQSSLDIILAATFATDTQATSAQADLPAKLQSIELPDNVDAEAIMPKAPSAEMYNTVIALADSGEIPQKSPLPVLHHTLALKLDPKLRKAVAHKEKTLDLDITKSLERMSGSSINRTAKCVVDLILQEEMQAAAKGRRVAE